MTNNFDDVQRFGKDQIEHLSASAASVTRGFQAIASEATDYSKRSLESTSSHFEKLLGVRSLDAVIQLQTEFTKSQVEGFVAQAAKIGEIYRGMAKEAFRPVEAAIDRGQQAVNQA